MDRDLDIARVRVYAVGPETTPRFRFSGQTEHLFMTYTIVRVTSRNGLEGSGGVDTEGVGDFDRSLAEKLQPLIGSLPGQSPLNRAKITQALLKDRTAPVPEAESLIDIALWDLVAVQADLPLYQLLGGARSCIPTYASSPVFETAGEYMDYTALVQAAGYPAVKFHTQGILDWDLRMVRAVHERFGETSMKFMLDLEQMYTREQALIIGRELSRLKYTWLEAPLDDTDLEGYRTLRSRVGVPVLSSGNTIVELSQIKKALDMGCWSALRTDPCVVGGITTALKVMALAESYGMSVELQSYGYPLSQAANLHLMLAAENCSYFEQPFPPEHYDYGARTPVQVDPKGFARAPSGSGLGVVIDWEQIESDAFLIYDTA